MTIKGFYHLLISIFLSASIVSCNDTFDEDLLSEGMGNESLASRSGDNSDYYYWYQGEKIGLSSLKDVYYIASPDSTLTSSTFSSSRNASIKNIIKQGVSQDTENRYWSIVELQKHQRRPLQNVLFLNLKIEIYTLLLYLVQPFKIVSCYK